MSFTSGDDRKRKQGSTLHAKQTFYKPRDTVFTYLDAAILLGGHTARRAVYPAIIPIPLLSIYHQPI